MYIVIFFGIGVLGCRGSRPIESCDVAFLCLGEEASGARWALGLLAAPAADIGGRVELGPQHRAGSASSAWP
eukprot:2920156-Pyramimonas_sp.AAC.1